MEREKCWSSEEDGDGGAAVCKIPLQVPTEHTAVSAAHFHMIFLKGDGTVLAAGLNNDGQLGDGTCSAPWDVQRCTSSGTSAAP